MKKFIFGVLILTVVMLACPAFAATVKVKVPPMPEEAIPDDGEEWCG